MNEHVENYDISAIGHMEMLSHLLVSEYVDEVEERERSGLKNQLPSVFRGLP